MFGRGGGGGFGGGGNNQQQGGGFGGGGGGGFGGGGNQQQGGGGGFGGGAQQGGGGFGGGAQQGGGGGFGGGQQQQGGGGFGGGGNNQQQGGGGFGGGNNQQQGGGGFGGGGGGFGGGNQQQGGGGGFGGGAQQGGGGFGGGNNQQQGGGGFGRGGGGGFGGGAAQGGGGFGGGGNTQQGGGGFGGGGNQQQGGGGGFGGGAQQGGGGFGGGNNQQQGGGGFGRGGGGGFGGGGAAQGGGGGFGGGGNTQQGGGGFGGGGNQQQGGGGGFGGGAQQGGGGFGGGNNQQQGGGGFGRGGGGGFGGGAAQGGGGFGGGNNTQQGGGGFGGGGNQQQGGGGFGGGNNQQQGGGGFGRGGGGGFGGGGAAQGGGGGFGGGNNQQQGGGGFGGNQQQGGGGFGGAQQGGGFGGGNNQQQGGGGFGGGGGGFGGGQQQGGGFGGNNQQQGGGFGGNNQQQGGGGFGNNNQQQGGGGFGNNNQQQGGGGFGGGNNQQQGGGFGNNNNQQQQGGGFGNNNNNNQQQGGGFGNNNNNTMNMNQAAQQQVIPQLEIIPDFSETPYGNALLFLGDDDRENLKNIAAIDAALKASASTKTTTTTKTTTSSSADAFSVNALYSGSAKSASYRRGPPLRIAPVGGLDTSNIRESFTQRTFHTSAHASATTINGGVNESAVTQRADVASAEVFRRILDTPMSRLGPKEDIDTTDGDAVASHNHSVDTQTPRRGHNFNNNSSSAAAKSAESNNNMSAANASGSSTIKKGRAFAPTVSGNCQFTFEPSIEVLQQEMTTSQLQTVSRFTVHRKDGKASLVFLEPVNLVRVELDSVIELTNAGNAVIYPSSCGIPCPPFGNGLHVPVLVTVRDLNPEFTNMEFLVRACNSWNEKKDLASHSTTRKFANFDEAANTFTYTLHVPDSTTHAASEDPADHEVDIKDDHQYNHHVPNLNLNAKHNNNNNSGVNTSYMSTSTVGIASPRQFTDETPRAVPIISSAAQATRDQSAVRAATSYSQVRAAWHNASHQDVNSHSEFISEQQHDGECINTSTTTNAKAESTNNVRESLVGGMTNNNQSTTSTNAVCNELPFTLPSFSVRSANRKQFSSVSASSMTSSIRQKQRNVESVFGDSHNAAPATAGTVLVSSTRAPLLNEISTMKPNPNNANPLPADRALGRSFRVGWAPDGSLVLPRFTQTRDWTENVSAVPEVCNATVFDIQRPLANAASSTDATSKSRATKISMLEQLHTFASLGAPSSTIVQSGSVSSSEASPTRVASSIEVSLADKTAQSSATHPTLSDDRIDSLISIVDGFVTRSADASSAVANSAQVAMYKQLKSMLTLYKALYGLPAGHKTYANAVEENHFEAHLRRKNLTQWLEAEVKIDSVDGESSNSKEAEEEYVNGDDNSPVALRRKVLRALLRHDMAAVQKFAKHLPKEDELTKVIRLCDAGSRNIHRYFAQIDGKHEKTEDDTTTATAAKETYNKIVSIISGEAETFLRNTSYQRVGDDLKVNRSEVTWKQLLGIFVFYGAPIHMSAQQVVSHFLARVETREVEAKEGCLPPYSSPTTTRSIGGNTTDHISCKRARDVIARGNSAQDACMHILRSFSNGSPVPASQALHPSSSTYFTSDTFASFLVLVMAQSLARQAPSTAAAEVAPGTISLPISRPVASAVFISAEYTALTATSAEFEYESAAAHADGKHQEAGQLLWWALFVAHMIPNPQDRTQAVQSIVRRHAHRVHQELGGVPDWSLAAERETSRKSKTNKSSSSSSTTTNYTLYSWNPITSILDISTIRAELLAIIEEGDNTAIRGGLEALITKGPGAAASVVSQIEQQNRPSLVTLQTLQVALDRFVRPMKLNH